MRKIFVVLMILAIAGGGFAQDEGKGTWGTISGEAELSTTIDFYNEGRANGSGEDGDPHTLGMDPGTGGWFKLAWDYEKDEWSIHLPLHVEDGKFGVEKNDDGDYLAKITYNPDSPLTIEMPFGFELDRGGYEGEGNWFLSATTFDTDITGTYETDEFMFKLGFGSVLTAPALSKVGGWYKLNDMITLAVSHGGATGSEWFRTSTIVREETPFGGTWENIDGNGIAIKFDIMENLSAGLSFAGGVGEGEAGSAIFGAGTDDFVKDFLTNPIIGVKFDGSPFKASLMTGLWTQARDAGNDNKLVSDIPLYLGLELNLDAGLYVGADLSALFVGQTKAEKDANLNAANDFNFGLEVMFDTTIGENPFWAGARLRALDVGYNEDDFGKYYSTVSAELYVGFNWARDGDPTHGDPDGFLNADFGRFGGRGNGFGARFWLGIPDLDVNPDFGMDLNIAAALGYGADLSEKLGFGINAMLGMATNSKAEESYDNVFGFKVVPELVWKLISNGSITFTYEFGATDILRNPDLELKAIDIIDINKFTIGFKWWL